MKKKSLLIICGVGLTALAVILGIVLIVFNSRNTATTIHLMKTENTVTVRDKNEKAVKIKENIGLYDGYGVNTAAESYAWINLDEHKLTKMDMDSSIHISAIDRKLEINLESGRIFFNVTKPLEDDEEFTIRKSNMVMGIRGTCGWVVADETETMKVYLLKGKVECAVLSDAADGTEEKSVTEIAEFQTVTMYQDGRFEVEDFTDIPDFVKEELWDSSIPEEAEKLEEKKKEEEKEEKLKEELQEADDAADVGETGGETGETGEEGESAEATALCDAGRASLFGTGGAGINLQAAWDNFVASTEAGGRKAMFYLGLMMDYYNYPNQDYSQAKAYYEALPEDGCALSALGMMYADGHGVGADLAEAERLFNEAVEKGYDEGYYGLGYLAEKKTKNYADAMQNYENALGSEDTYFNYRANNSIGYMYCNGFGVAKDYETAMENFTTAANLGDSLAMNNIGYMYENGFGVARDYGMAMQWYQKAADLGNAGSMCGIGALYYNGFGVAADEETAISWFKRAAALGDPTAAQNLKALGQ